MTGRMRQIAGTLRDSERDMQLLTLRLRSPQRTTTPQADAGHLPLFIAGNEGKLL